MRGKYDQGDLFQEAYIVFKQIYLKYGKVDLFLYSKALKSHFADLLNHKAIGDKVFFEKQEIILSINHSKISTEREFLVTRYVEELIAFLKARNLLSTARVLEVLQSSEFWMYITEDRETAQESMEGVEKTQSDNKRLQANLADIGRFLKISRSELNLHLEIIRDYNNYLEEIAA